MVNDRRLERLLALEVRRVVEDLRSRRDLLLHVWGKHRARKPLIETIFTRWTTVGMPDLAQLDPAAAAALDGFHRELDGLRLYLEWTEDMPRNLAVVYDQTLTRLEHLAAMALTALGEPPLEPIELPWDEPDDAREE